MRFQWFQKRKKPTPTLNEIMAQERLRLQQIEDREKAWLVKRLKHEFGDDLYHALGITIEDGESASFTYGDVNWGICWEYRGWRISYKHGYTHASQCELKTKLLSYIAERTS